MILIFFYCHENNTSVKTKNTIVDLRILYTFVLQSNNIFLHSCQVFVLIIREISKNERLYWQKGRVKEEFEIRSLTMDPRQLASIYMCSRGRLSFSRTKPIFFIFIFFNLTEHFIEGTPDLYWAKIT